MEPNYQIPKCDSFALKKCKMKTEIQVKYTLFRVFWDFGLPARQIKLEQVVEFHLAKES